MESQCEQVIMMLFFVLAPLLVFTPRLARTKRIGLAEYGGLAQRYVREFDQKWLRGRSAGRRTAGGQRGHPIAGRPGQQL